VGTGTGAIAGGGEGAGIGAIAGGVIGGIGGLIYGDQTAKAKAEAKKVEADSLSLDAAVKTADTSPNKAQGSPHSTAKNDPASGLLVSPLAMIYRPRLTPRGVLHNAPLSRLTGGPPDPRPNQKFRVRVYDPAGRIVAEDVRPLVNNAVEFAHTFEYAHGGWYRFELEMAEDAKIKRSWEFAVDHKSESIKVR